MGRKLSNLGLVSVLAAAVGLSASGCANPQRTGEAQLRMLQFVLGAHGATTSDPDKAAVYSMGSNVMGEVAEDEARVRAAREGRNNIVVNVQGGQGCRLLNLDTGEVISFINRDIAEEYMDQLAIKGDYPKEGFRYIE
jgi:hypothetical protein